MLKRRIFFPHHHVRGPDHVFEQLTYLQAEEAALVDGHIMVDDDDKAFALASMSIAVAYRDNLGFSVGEIVDAGIQKYVAPDFRANKTPQEWAAMVLEMRDTLVSTDAEDLQDSFLQICQANLFYGKFWFYVHRVEPVAHTIYPDTLRGIPTDLILGFGHDGMLVCDHTHSRYGLFPYGDIFRWSGTESEMTLVLAEASLPDAFEFNILTSQSADIEATILDHIRTTMAEQAAIQNTTF